MSNRPEKQLQVVSLILLVIIAIVALLGIPNRLFGNEFWTWLGAFFTPVPMYSDDEASGGIRFAYFFCYLLGTIVFSGIIVAVFTNIIRTAGERYTNGTAKYKLCGHVLFLGFDDMMIGTLRKELADNPKADVVVAVPGDAAMVRNMVYQYLTSEESERVVVIQASRVNIDDMKVAAQVQTAKRIYLIGQADEETHDAINLKSISLIAGLCAPLNKRPQCMYYMRNQATFSLIQRQGIGADDLKVNIETAGMTFDRNAVKKYIGECCESFNFYEIAARRLLFNMPDYGNSLMPDWHNESRNLHKQPDLKPHLVILGMTEMGTALARETLMTVHYPNNKLRITFVDDNAYEEMHYFIGKYKSFFDNCKYTYRDLNKADKPETHKAENGDFLDVEFEFLQCDVAHPDLQKRILDWAEDKKELLTLAVCTNITPKNMAFALYLHRPVLAQVPVWVYQKRDDSMNPFLRHDIYENVRTFSLTDISVATPDAPEYKWARTVAEFFDKHYGGHSPWSEKRASDRWSSLYNALSIIAKIRLAGYGVTVSDDGMLHSFRLNDRNATGPIVLSLEQVKTLSMVEHNRWNSEKLMMGFKPSSKEQHQALTEGKITAQSLKDNFIHDNIRPFEELDPKEKEKDFVLTQAIIEAINNYKAKTL